MLAVVFLSSCSNIVQLKKEAHNQIRSVENIIVIEQDNLYVTVTSFYNGGGGAIGALIASSIDSSRQSSATEKAQPIIKELDDYNFKNVFLTAIKDKINKTHLPYKMSNQVESINSASNKRIHLLKTNSDALLVFDCGLLFLTELYLNTKTKRLLQASMHLICKTYSLLCLKSNC
jgi:hypothetical protein